MMYYYVAERPESRAAESAWDNPPGCVGQSVRRPVPPPERPPILPSVAVQVRISPCRRPINISFLWPKVGIARPTAAAAQSH